MISSPVPTQITIPFTSLENEDIKKMLEIEEFNKPDIERGVCRFYKKTSYPDYENLTRFLIEHNIPFDLRNGHNLNFQAKCRYYRPALNDTEVYDKTILLALNGEPIMPVSAVKIILNLPAEKQKGAFEKLVEQADLIPPLEEWIKETGWGQKAKEEIMKGCPNCGNKGFFAHQVCHLDIVVDADNNWQDYVLGSKEDSVYDGETPYGPYTCTKCGMEFNELPATVDLVEKVE